MQAIRRCIREESGFIAYDDVSILNMSDFVVYRSLTLNIKKFFYFLDLDYDGNARRLSLRIDKSFKEVVGNDALMHALRWQETMAKNMRISQYRFKNPMILIGK